MSFVHQKSEVKRWHIDPETLAILQELKDTDIYLQGIGIPSLQPSIRLINSPSPILTLRWEYELFNTDNKVVLALIFEDSYTLTVKTLSTHHAREMVALSYDRLAVIFDELNEPTRIDAGIEQPSESQFDSLCQGIIQFLKEKFSK